MVKLRLGRIPFETLLDRCATSTVLQQSSSFRRSLHYYLGTELELQAGGHGRAGRASELELAQRLGTHDTTSSAANAAATGIDVSNHADFDPYLTEYQRAYGGGGGGEHQRAYGGGGGGEHQRADGGGGQYQHGQHGGHRSNVPTMPVQVEATISHARARGDGDGDDDGDGDGSGGGGGGGGACGGGGGGDGGGRPTGGSLVALTDWLLSPSPLQAQLDAALAKARQAELEVMVGGLVTDAMLSALAQLGSRH